MALCLVAEGWLENGRRCIAFCCDTSGERGGMLQEPVGSEGAWKLREIGANVALVSGAETPAGQLLALCDKTIANFGVQRFGEDFELAVDRFLQALRTHAGAHKRTLVEHWVQFNLGISFDYFLKHHREQFDPGHARDIWKQIQDINLEADLIVCGFQDDYPVIARMDRYGNVFWEHNYFAVGSGSDIAYPFLAQRDWDEYPTMWQCVQYLYEAKQAAQPNLHMGPHARVSVLMQDRKNYALKFAGSEKLGVKLTVQWKTSKSGFTGSLLEILVDKPAPPPPVEPPSYEPPSDEPLAYESTSDEPLPDESSSYEPDEQEAIAPEPEVSSAEYPG